MALPQTHGSSQIHDILALLPQVNKTIFSGSYDARKVARVTTEHFLPYLPSRCGHSVSLDAAIDCVAARLRHIWRSRASFQPGIIDIADVSTQTQKLYAEALKTLRCALDDPAESVKAETLAAAQLLCCFDVCKT